MLVCKDCGKEYEDYDEIDNWKEPHGEEACGCSKCGGEVVEAEYCECCNKYKPEEEIIDEIECCEECQNKIIDEFMKRIKNMYNTDKERYKIDIINNYFEYNEFEI